eukprot:1651074-Pleurochrysis_carterae.AAC.3
MNVISQTVLYVTLIDNEACKSVKTTTVHTMPSFQGAKSFVLETNPANRSFECADPQSHTLALLTALCLNGNAIGISSVYERTFQQHFSTTVGNSQGIFEHYAGILCLCTLSRTPLHARHVGLRKDHLTGKVFQQHVQPSTPTKRGRTKSGHDAIIVSEEGNGLIFLAAELQ